MTDDRRGVAVAGGVHPDGAGLVARTVRVDIDIDPLDVCGVDGVLFQRGAESLAGRGEALRIPVDGTRDLAAVGDVLARIEVIDDVDRPGTGPVAFGALPFDPTTPSSLVVPEVIVGRADDGTRWVTTVGPASDDGATTPDRWARLAGGSTTDDGGVGLPGRYTVEAERDADDWMRTVSRATDAIAHGAFQKVVLARAVRVTADEPIPRPGLLGRLRRAFPGCYAFAVGDLVGASPELLVSRHGDIVRAHPMAGTAPRGGDPTTDARLAASLLASAKDRAEHQITIDMVWDTLLPFCSYVDAEPEPSIVAVANVQHLASVVEGRLSQPAASVVELVAALHPTPAVAGWPVEESLAFLAEHEELDRGAYAGPVGWVDSGGNGTWAVGIRSAILSGDTARLFAGVGVVADSDPTAELAETQAKFQAMLANVIRP